MSHFLDQEAEESDDSGVDLVRNVGRSARDLEEEEEEEDEETLRNEMKGFINDDEDDEDVEEENHNDSDDGMNRRRKNTEDAENLDEDDYALIEENIGGPIQRKKKLKRVIRVADDDSDSDRDENDREAIAKELFDGDEEPPISSHRRDKTVNKPADYCYNFSEESDDENSFIVDDEDQPVAKSWKRKGHRHNNEAGNRLRMSWRMSLMFGLILRNTRMNVKRRDPRGRKADPKRRQSKRRASQTFVITNT